jgi:hypothetical protein
MRRYPAIAALINAESGPVRPSVRPLMAAAN